VEPWWFYGPALLAAFLPATLLLPALFAKRSPARPDDERQTSLFGLLVGWSLLSLVALSASQGKETRYLLPTIPGWALLASWAWYRSDPMPWLASWRVFLARTGLVLAWIVPLGLAVAGWQLRPAAWPWLAIATALAFLALALLMRGRRRALAGMMWAALLFEILALRIFWASAPMANRNERYPIAAMGAEIAAHLGPGETLVQLGEYSSYIQLQVDRPFHLARSRADLEMEMAGSAQSRFILARSHDLAQGDEDGWIEVASWPFGSSTFRLLRVP
jgi:4-amino-4-deoxy-L-arabinose transferase-like glycosyltransferase